VAVTTVADLPLLTSGKVREMYDLGDEVLMVASDRISTYDVVHPTPIPDKGKVLSGLSAMWFDRTAGIVTNHLLSATDGVPDEVRGRALRVRKLKMLPVECVVRGYVTGSGWKDYQSTGAICGISLPAGLQESEQLPEPIFTPATKADEGDHDENIDFDRAAEIVGDRALLERARDVSIALYSFGLAHARERGIILADTKFEFGLDESGELVLGDEAMTPDSSRFWPADEYEPGHGQRSFDKQYVRDWAAGSGWDKTPPRRRSPTTLSPRRGRSMSRPTSGSATSRSTPGWSAPHREGSRPRPPQGRHPRSPGQGRRAGAARAGLRRGLQRPCRSPDRA
jgi:phosphoribosylaminoimidazole-succinocarboxamide synthase